MKRAREWLTYHIQKYYWTKMCQQMQFERLLMEIWNGLLFTMQSRLKRNDHIFKLDRGINKFPVFFSSSFAYFDQYFYENNISHDSSVALWTAEWTPLKQFFLFGFKTKHKNWNLFKSIICHSICQYTYSPYVICEHF